MTTIQDFLTTLFSRAPAGSYLELRAVGGSGKVKKLFWPVENLRELEIPHPGDRNVLFGVLPRKRRSGKAKDVAAGTCLWIDLDGPALRPWKHPPTVVIETSPGRFQVFWLLNKPLDDLDLLENLNRRLAQCYGGDPNCVDRARVLRMPGFPNMKYDSRPLARVLTLRPDRVYDARTLDKWLPPLKATENNRSRKPAQPPNCNEPTTWTPPRVNMTPEEIAVATWEELWAALGITLTSGNKLYRCVFHDDSTPSLSIDRDRQLFNCFGCGKGGGLLALKMSAIVFNTNRSLKTTADTLTIPRPGPWLPYPSPGRACGFRQIQRNRVQRTCHRVRCLNCGKWDCANCGPYLKVKWLEHLRDKFMREPGVTLTLRQVKPEDFEALQRKIERRGGKYTRIELESGGYAVFTNAFEGGMPLDQVLQALEEVIAGLPFDKKRISTSSGWKPQESQKTGEWEKVGSTNATIEEARAVVEGAGLMVINPWLSNMRRGWRCQDAFEFEVPQSWLDNGGENYGNLLKWLRLGVPPEMALAA